MIIKWRMVLLVLVMCGLMLLPRIAGGKSSSSQLKELQETIAKVRAMRPSAARTKMAEHLAEQIKRMDPKDIDDNTLVEIISLLNDSDDSVRAWAAASLGYLGPRARTAVPKLLEVLAEVGCVPVVGGQTSEGVIRVALKRIGTTPPAEAPCEPRKGD